MHVCEVVLSALLDDVSFIAERMAHVIHVSPALSLHGFIFQQIHCYII